MLWDESADQLLIPQSDDLTNPALGFIGDPDTGIYSKGTGQINFSSNASESLRIAGNNLTGGATGSFFFQNRLASAIAPTVSPHTQDGDTGLGWAAADQLSLIAGADEIARLSEAGEHNIFALKGAVF